MLISGSSLTQKYPKLVGSKNQRLFSDYVCRNYLTFVPSGTTPRAMVILSGGYCVEGGSAGFQGCAPSGAGGWGGGYCHSYHHRLEHRHFGIQCNHWGYTVDGLSKVYEFRVEIAFLTLVSGRMMRALFYKKIGSSASTLRGEFGIRSS